MRYRQSFVLLSCLLLLSCGGGGGGGNNDNDAGGGTNPPPVATGAATVLAFNDLGMHCMDREFSVFSILPPFNVVHSQVVLRDATGRPYLADDLTVDVFYDAATDPSGSINSYSRCGKTDFWQHASDLFGVNLAGRRRVDRPLHAGRRPAEPGRPTDGLQQHLGVVLG